MKWAVSRPFWTDTGLKLKLGDTLRMFTKFRMNDETLKTDIRTIRISDELKKKYTGQFKNGNIKGQGTVTFADGRKFKGRFISQSSGMGKLIFKNGKQCAGSFQALK